MKKLVPRDAILIPDYADNVFRGKIFDVYQWQQQLFDGSQATFEMLKRADTTDIMVVNGEDILLLEDEQPNRGIQICLPSGRVEKDEEWIGAAKRELAEETGLICSEWRLLDVSQPINKIEWFVPLYLAKNIIKIGKQKLDGGEKIRPSWKKFIDVRQDVISGKVKTMAYLMPFFNKVHTIHELESLPEFSGLLIER